ncbi:hypothetical protein [Nitrosomonas halophila]|uniref:Uncharacterized protein n=1 Tax=Nitrosomonas halophila TaxID=44576 RepID=A0A1H3DV94_9PROT|nr:hypothetical protein [Nitrosomonas halophila]SDX70462.1 hypothetical protein SAMN05421881_100639 [Nitrosomonas halophila]
MNRNIAGFKDSIATLMALLLFAVALLASPMVLAAVHHIALTAETLPNGQLAYKLAGQPSRPANEYREKHCRMVSWLTSWLTVSKRLFQVRLYSLKEVIESMSPLQIIPPCR